MRTSLLRSIQSSSAVSAARASRKNHLIGPATVTSQSRFLSATPYEEPLHYDTVRKGDMGEFQEYSVIFTNRALNLMSKPFQQVMRDLNALLKSAYNAEKVAIMPG